MDRMKNRKQIFLVFLVFMISFGSFAQSDLLEILDKEHSDSIRYTSATFKMTRIAIGHSTETRKKGILEVFSANRFWNTGADNSQSFFADKVSARIALEYGLSDRLSFGFGGTTFDGLFDGYLKYKLMRQRSGKNVSPFNITFLQASSYNSNSFRRIYGEATRSSDKRMSFTSQLLISKKFSSKFSVQLAPTFIHRGVVLSNEDPKNHFALGFGARYKLGNHLSLVSEYYYNANKLQSFDTYNPFVLGVNWEQGDVMLQFMLTNTRNMVEDTFITATRNNFNFRNPNLNFGFNATYVIHFKRGLKKKSK